MKRIGLVPGSFKPYHKGHDELVRIASEENDEVLLFVSLSDRIKKGEFPIHGEAMRRVWDTYLRDAVETSYPNVKVIYVESGTPVSMVYDEIGKADAGASEDVYQIYSDTDDIRKYSAVSLKKYAPGLVARQKIKLRGVGRGETVDISGTEMRELLADGEAEAFIKMLPTIARKHGREIYNLLRSHQTAAKSIRKKKISAENFLRAYIKLIVD